MYCPLLSVVYHSQCIHLKLFSSMDFLEPVSRNKISTKPIFVTQSLHVQISISKILMFDLGMIARWWNLIKLQIQINLQWSSCHTKQLRFLLFFSFFFFLFFFFDPLQNLLFQNRVSIPFSISSLESQIPKNPRWSEQHIDFLYIFLSS